MKIVQVNTYDIQGGAARAAYRLHKGLLLLGQDSVLLSRYKVSSDPTVRRAIAEEPQDDLESLRFSAIQSHYIDNNRTSLTNTLFSLSYPGFDLSQQRHVLEAEIINLHWVSCFQSPITLKNLFDLGKPVVWTLHDMWAFTGGCHYSAGCEKYQDDCSACPQLSKDFYNLARAVLKDKLSFFENANLTIVTPSQWLADCVRKSKLFHQNRIEVIPYSLETEDIFVPIEKSKAKSIFGISPETITLLFGAGTATEERKGFSYLVEAIHHCLEYPNFRDLVARQRVEILCFGYPSELLYSLGIPVRSLGSFESDFKLSQVYSAADLFILPSLEDNLPNTMLEAMSCGTPVIGFDTGGIPDLVKDYNTGRLVPLKDTHKLAEAIINCIFNPALLAKMSQICRQTLEDQYSITTQAQHYLNLYQDLLCSTGRAIVMETSGQPPNSFFENNLEQDNSKYGAISTLSTSLGKNSAEIFDQITHQALLAKLQYTQASLTQVKNDLVETQTTLAQTQSHLTQTQTDLEAARQGWTQNQSVLEQVQDSLAAEQALRTGLEDQLTDLKATFDHSKAVFEYGLAEKKQIIGQLQDQIQSIEMVRSQIIQTLSSSNEHLKYRFQDLNQSIKKLKHENQELVQSKDHLEQELAYLSTGKAAVRKIFKVALRKLRIYDLVYTHYKFFVPVYNVLFRDRWNPATVAELPAAGLPAIEQTTTLPKSPQSTPPTTAKSSPKIAPKSSEVDMESPLIQSLVTVRHLGDTRETIDLDLLNWLSTLSETTRRVLCIQPSHTIVPLLQLLQQKGATVTCIDCQGDRTALQTYGFEAIVKDLPKWMMTTNRSHFHDFDLICIHAHLSDPLLLLLKGRLSPNTKVIVHTASTNHTSANTVAVNQTHDSIVSPGLGHL